MLVFKYMTGKFKFLILLVALVALPLRGLAAVATWHCAQDQRDAMTVSAGPPPDAHGTHGEAAAGHSDHHSHDTSVQDGSAGETASPAASACSACTACCMGGSIAPTGWSSLSFLPGGASRIAFFEQNFTGFVPAQLERPPLLLPL
ncbi:MAG: hypothetical protein JSS40_05365 [Proteobacteria bacterium]|nr:hypothetical protein [Pseudomonadota bacterium]